MNLTHAQVGTTTGAWPATPAAAAGPGGSRIEGFSAGDRSLLSGAFTTPRRSRPGHVLTADPMGRFGIDTDGAASWKPPFLPSGYHDSVAISVDIDAEYGGGFVTRPPLPRALAESEVLRRLIRQARALVPPVQVIAMADVHAVRIRGGSRWIRSAIAPARAMVAVLVDRPSGPPTPRPGPSARMPSGLRRPFDAIAWPGHGRVPDPAEVIDGGSGDVLLIAFRG